SSWFGSRLDFDFTFYHALSTDQYMVGSNASGKLEPMNSGKISNTGVETTIGYNFKFGKDWRWKTSYNLSYNDNEILETTYNPDGSEKLVYQDVGEVRVRYKKGGSIGDMYVTDYKRNADGTLAVTADGRLSFESESSKKYTVYAGNMNSKWQMGWSNTVNYKNFQLFFLINGRIGGKVISLTESYLDNLGLSERTANARLAAEQNNMTVDGKPALMLNDGTGRLVPIESYYTSIAGTRKSPLEYIYDATNFRLRELSLGYTFQNLLGMGSSLNVSFIARNLFFLYKKSPADPDVSLSTGNGLGAFELFNMPSSRSYGFSLKLTF
ncbi:MAG: SusC/RagA family TonB-linked outer membrane protein, partial [Prevotella sp.]|nr:SusC/RagA family TonB-linked outer membrane protein [Prevotella sp.]